MKTTKDLETSYMHRPEVKARTPYSKSTGKAQLHGDIHKSIHKTLYK